MFHIPWRRMILYIVKPFCLLLKHFTLGQQNDHAKLSERQKQMWR